LLGNPHVLMRILQAVVHFLIYLAPLDFVLEVIDTRT